jgi:hypothetical protein
MGPIVAEPACASVVGEGGDRMHTGPGTLWLALLWLTTIALALYAAHRLFPPGANRSDDDQEGRQR